MTIASYKSDILIALRGREADAHSMKKLAFSAALNRQTQQKIGPT
jgi:hypothetical protein